MNPLIKRFIFPVIMALVLAGFSLAAAHAQSETPPATPAPDKTCASCHPEVHAGWHQGAHSDTQMGVVRQKEQDCLACHKEFPLGVDQAQTNPGSTFQKTWQEQGKRPDCLNCHVTGYDPSTGKYKSEGIACEACHGDPQPDHPNTKMPIDVNNDLCRKCHTDERFDWNSWKSSIHFQNKMKCTNCHDPHTTSLKIAGAAVSDPSALCMNCHKDKSQDLQHSIHAAANVSCVTCHLGPKKGNDDFHQVPDHSFKPSLETCMGCHDSQMHSLGDSVKPTAAAVSLEAAGTGTPVPTLTPVPVTTEKNPAPVSAIGFTGLAGLLGMLCGAVIVRTFRKR
jgi:predicted CXXCH cytochrome family protein